MGYVAAVYLITPSLLHSLHVTFFCNCCPLGLSRLKHLLLVIRCLLIEPNPDSALNEEAGKLLLEDYEEFSRRAQLMTQIHAAGPVSTAGNENAAPGSKNDSSTPASPGKTKAASVPKAAINKAAVQKKKAAKRL